MSRLTNGTVRRAAFLAAAGLAVMTTLSSCSSTPEAPAGYTTHELGRISLPLPEGWVPIPDDALNDSWTWGMQDQAGADATRQVLVSLEGLDEDTAELGLAHLVASSQIGQGLPGWRTAGKDDIEVDGATSAVRENFTYEPSEGTELYGTWLVAADDDAGRALMVQVTATDDDEDLIQAISQGLVLSADEEVATPAPA